MFLLASFLFFSLRTALASRRGGWVPELNSTPHPPTARDHDRLQNRCVPHERVCDILSDCPAPNRCRLRSNRCKPILKLPRNRRWGCPVHLCPTAAFCPAASYWPSLQDAAQSGLKLPEEEQSLLDLAFNLFILMYQLQTFSEDEIISDILKSCSGYDYFRGLLGMVEIARGQNLERVYFHIPNECLYLTTELKTDIMYKIDRSSPIAKVTSFHTRARELVAEIEHYQQVTDWLEANFLPLPESLATFWPKATSVREYLIQNRERVGEQWENYTLYVAVVINVLVTAFHDPKGEQYPHPFVEHVVEALSWFMVLLTAPNCICYEYVRTIVMNKIKLETKSGQFKSCLSHLYPIGLMTMSILGMPPPPDVYPRHAPPPPCGRALCVP